MTTTSAGLSPAELQQAARDHALQNRANCVTLHGRAFLFVLKIDPGCRRWWKLYHRGCAGVKTIRLALTGHGKVSGFRVRGNAQRVEQVEGLPPFQVVIWDL